MKPSGNEVPFPTFFITVNFSLDDDMRYQIADVGLTLVLFLFTLLFFHN